MANSMIGGVSDNDVWYVDSGASNHMTSHGEWFRDTKDLKTLGFVEKLVMTLHIPSHKLARCHCPCKMGK
jgi:hypothetical protein